MRHLLLIYSTVHGNHRDGFSFSAVSKLSPDLNAVVHDAVKVTSLSARIAHFGTRREGNLCALRNE